MQPVGAIASYTGPRPSPGKRWAPVLVVAMAAAVLTNTVLLGLNVVERHNLQRIKAGHPVSSAFFEDTLSTLNAANRISLVISIAVVVAAIVWATKRRSPGRRREEGEAAVEPALIAVSRVLYTAFWVALAIALFSSEGATSARHTGMTIDDLIGYRTYIAAADLFRAAMWGSYAALVLKATRLQDRRELATNAVPALDLQ
jgi:hypothetical protein